MKNIALFAFTALIGSSSYAGIRTKVQNEVDLKDQISLENSYTLSLNAAVTPLNVYSSIAARVPAKFQILCDGKTLGEDSFLYNRNLKNSSIALHVEVDNFEQRCPSLKTVVSLEPNGVELATSESFFTYELSTTGLSYNGIQGLRPQKAADLVKLVSALSQIGGSEESFNCLIQDYLTDPLMTGPIESIRNEYEKIYGTFDATKYVCPVAADGALARNVDTCEANPSDLSLFCLVYARYKEQRTWYGSSIVRLEAILSKTDESLADLRKQIQELMDTLQADIDSKERMLTIK